MAQPTLNPFSKATACESCPQGQHANVENAWLSCTNCADGKSTFGIGKNLSKVEWQNIFRQLVSRNLLMVDVNEHNGIKITDKGFAFLKKKQSIDLRKVSEKQKAKREKPARRTKPALEDEDDQELYEKLKEARQLIAKKRRVPAYVIFHDKTLIELADKRPQSFEEMLEINGIGESKLKKFGQTLLDVILAT